MDNEQSFIDQLRNAQAESEKPRQVDNRDLFQKILDANYDWAQGVKNGVSGFAKWYWDGNGSNPWDPTKETLPLWLTFSTGNKDSLKQAYDTAPRQVQDAFMNQTRQFYGSLNADERNEYMSKLRTNYINAYDTAHSKQTSSYTSEGGSETSEESNSSDETTESQAGGSNTSANQSPFSDDVAEGDYVTFSYQPGDTFGQKILDLGLATNNGLWGDDGDVNFYTRQLIDQDALDANGNVKLGQTFKLRRRK